MQWLIQVSSTVTNRRQNPSYFPKISPIELCKCFFGRSYYPQQSLAAPNVQSTLSCSIHHAICDERFPWICPHHLLFLLFGFVSRQVPFHEVFKVIDIAVVVGLPQRDHVRIQPTICSR